MPGNVWNPNAPALLGNEWWPMVPWLTNPRDGFAQRLRSRSAETITKLRWSATGAPGERRRSMMLCEIMEFGTEIPVTGADVKTVEYAPNEDASNPGTWYKRVGGTTTNLYQAVNASPVTYPPVPYGSWGILNKQGVPAEVRFHVGSAAFPLTYRVLRLSMVAVVGSTGPIWRDMDFRLFDEAADVAYPIPGSHYLVHMYGQYIELDLGEINPKSVRPWTPQDVRDFDTAATGWSLRVEGWGDKETQPQLIALGLKVYYQENENRLAVAMWRRPAADLAITQAIESDSLVTMPGGTANWAKATGKDYTFLHRAARDRLVQGTAAVATDVRLDSLFRVQPISSPVASPVPGMVGSTVTLDRWGRVLVTPPWGVDARTMTLMMLKAGPVVSEDSQPYAVGTDGWTRSNKVYSGVVEYQEVTPGVTASWLGVDFIAIPPVSSTASLTVQVKTTAMVNVGGSFTITPATARALAKQWGEHRRITGWLASAAALTSGTQYRITFTSSAPSSDAWYIGTTGVPDTWFTSRGVPAPAGGVATFGGTTDVGTTLGTEDSGMDLMAVLIQQPAVPTGPTAAAVDVTDTNLPNVACAALYCTPGSFQVVQFSWSASAYSGFDHWEIEREEADLPNVWVHLIDISSEAQKSWSDYAARRGIGVRYRVRAFLTTGAWTNWATSGTATPVAKDAEVIYASDNMPSLTCVYDREPEVVYKFLSTEEDTFVIVAGQDYQQVFATPRERGVSFEHDVIVNMIHQPTKAGVAVFDPLRELARSTIIPYVVVLDHEGQRFYVHLQVPEGVNEQPEHVYTAKVTATEVTDEPVVIEA